MNYRLILSMTTAIILPSTIFAAHFGVMSPDTSWVGSLSGGAVWTQSTSARTFYLTPTIEKTYSPQESSQGLFNGAVFLGLQKTVTPTIRGHFGVSAGWANSAKIKGEIWTDADPDFNNHAYRYKIDHAQLSLKGVLLTEMSHELFPWVSGSLGLGINSARGFNNTSLVCGELPNPNYTTKTTNSMTYTVGVGIQKAMNPHVQLGVGYEFSDWGKSELGRAPEQTLNKGLGLSHFYTNGLLINLTYLS